MRLVLASLLILSAIGATQTLAKPRDGAEQSETANKVKKSSANGPNAPSFPSASCPSVVYQSATTNCEYPTKEKAQSVWEKTFPPETRSNWALFLAALGAGFIALRTLKQIRIQSSTMLVSQRAQLIAVIQSPIQGVAIGQQPIVPVEIKNAGISPAYHCSYETWIEVLDVPFADFTTAADYFKAPFPTTIYSNSPAPVVVYVTLKHFLTSEEYLEFSRENRSLCVRVRIEYEDAFKEKRWCEFGYEFTGERVGALPKYNDAN
jgi:hypothetical protein